MEPFHEGLFIAGEEYGDIGVVCRKVQGWVCSISGKGAISSRIIVVQANNWNGDRGHQDVHRESLVLPQVCSLGTSKDVYILEYAQGWYQRFFMKQSIQ